MEYKEKRNRTISSFNSLMNAVARTNNVSLKKTALRFQELFDEFTNETILFDDLFIEKDILEHRSKRFELLLSLFIPSSLNDAISDEDILEIKRLQGFDFYTVRPFIEDTSMISEMRMYKKMGFRFKNGLKREELRVKIDNCRKKLAEKYANNKKQPE